TVGRARAGLATFRLDLLGLAAVLARRVADPEEREHDRDHAADRREHLRVDDQPDEDDGDADREPDRVQRRGREVLTAPVLGLHYRTAPAVVTTLDSTPALP